MKSAVYAKCLKRSEALNQNGDLVAEAKESDGVILAVEIGWNQLRGDRKRVGDQPDAECGCKRCCGGSINTGISV